MSTDDILTSNEVRKHYESSNFAATFANSKKKLWKLSPGIHKLEIYVMW